MGDFGVARDKWVCPNDRELSLRAKLKTGWSVKTNSINSFSKPEQLNDAEQEAIVHVIKRAENLEKVEQERVGRLVERLDNMKKNAMGNGTTQCVLCADEFGLLGASPQPCNDCKKAVCTKCGVDTLSAQKEPLWLCKICAETRETWKKSGAWFYKGLPKYILPGRKVEQPKYTSTPVAPSGGRDHGTASPVRSYNTWLQGRGRGSSDREYTDSSDDEIKSGRLSRRHTSRRHVNDSVESNDSPITFPGSQATEVGAVQQRVSPPHLQVGSVGPTHGNSSYPAGHDSSEIGRPEQAAVAYNRDHESEAYRSVAKGAADPSQGAATFWFRPKRESEEEECAEKVYRGHARRDSQHSIGSGGHGRVRGPQPAVSRERNPTPSEGPPPFEEKPSPDDTSKGYGKRLIRRMKKAAKRHQH